MFGDVVRAHRRRLGLSQEDLAAKAGVSVRTIGKIEANRIAAPRPATVRLLGEVFGLQGEAWEQFCAQSASALEDEPPQDPAPNALPAAPPTFTGRDEHLAQLDSLLSGLPPTRVAAITGSGGIGKTALALHWAHRSQHEFPDGLLYVDLRGFSHRPPLPPVDALWRLLHQLGVPPEKIPMHEEYAADLYRAQVSGKRIFVLLDNARNSEHVRPLLPGGSTCRALVTSRTVLSGLVARDSAWPVRLDVLNAAQARRLLAAILDSAVDGPDLDELAQLCAYVPLALRIAAASLVGQPAERLRQYVVQMRSADRLGTLQLDGDDHTAMGATFQLSYELLEPGAQRLFRLLSLVQGSDFTLDTAADLAGVPGSQARALLAAIAGAHLVQERLPGRYGFHDLLRLYAAKLLATHESETERGQGLERLYAHYLSRVDAAARLLYPQVLRLPISSRAQKTFEHHSDAEAIAWLDAERKNLVAAISSGVDQGQRQAASHLADAMRGYFFLRMFTVDWHTVAHAAFQAAQACDDRPAQAAALLSLADLHWRQGEYDAADTVYGHAVEHAVAGGWTAGQATALGNLGALRRMQGRLIEGAHLIRQSLALNVEVGRTEGQAVNLGNLSLVYGELGDWEQAEDYGTRAYDLYRQIGSRTAHGRFPEQPGRSIASARPARPGAGASPAGHRHAPGTRRQGRRGCDAARSGPGTQGNRRSAPGPGAGPVGGHPRRAKPGSTRDGAVPSGHSYHRAPVRRRWGRREAGLAKRRVGPAAPVTAWFKPMRCLGLPSSTAGEARSRQRSTWPAKPFLSRKDPAIWAWPIRPPPSSPRWRPPPTRWPAASAALSLRP